MNDSQWGKEQFSRASLFIKQGNKKKQNQVEQVTVIQHIFLAKMVWGVNAASIIGSKK